MGVLPGSILVAAAFGAASWFLSKWLTEAAVRWARREGVLAHPNERSSHEEATPRLGGVGLVGGFVPVLLLFLVLSPFIEGSVLKVSPLDEVPWLLFAGLIGSTLIAFAVGLWDDRRDIPAGVKFSGQALAALVAVGCGLIVRQLQLPIMAPIQLPWIVGATVAFCWIILVTNAVNFMDGVNGLAGTLGVVLGVTLFSFGFNRAWSLELVVMGAALFGASQGFLAYNYPKASTFLGDCGSQALGMLAAASILYVANNDLHGVAAFSPQGEQWPMLDPFIGAMIVLTPFLFDVLFTLWKRIKRGENPLRAHREHLYQRYLIARGGNHVETTQFASTSLYVAAVIAFLYVRFSEPGQNQFRMILLASAVVNLVFYWQRVRAAEQTPASQSPPTE